EMAAIDRQLAAIARRIDAQYGALEVADVAAQGRILEAAMPEYRQLANKGARQAFLADLRRHGVFSDPSDDPWEPPRRAGRGWRAGSCEAVAERGSGPGIRSPTPALRRRGQPKAGRPRPGR